MRMSFSKLFTFRKPYFDFFELLFFLYCFTLHADKLSISKGGMTLRLNNIIAIVLLGCILLRGRHRLFAFDKRFVLAIGFLLCSMVISFLNSAYPARCFFFLGWFGFTMLCYVLLPYFFIMEFDWKRVLKIYFLSFVLVGTFAALQFMLSTVGLRDHFTSIAGRSNAFSYEPSYYVLYMAPFVTIINLHFLIDRNKEFPLFKKVQLKHVLFVNFLNLISISTSAFFAYFIFIFIMSIVLFLSSWKETYSFLKKRLFQFGGFLFLGTAAGFVVFPNLIKAVFLKFFFFGFMSHHSFFERWIGIVAAWKIFLRFPLLGVGPGAIPSYLYDAWREKDPILGALARYIATLDPTLKMFEPTNVFTEILGSLGLLGLCAFGFLFFSFWSVVSRATALSEEERHWVFLFFISTLISLIVLQFNQSLFRTYVWTHFAMSYAIAIKCLRNQATVSPKPLSIGVVS